MRNMAADLGFPDFFKVGSVISCKTCSNKDLEGEVLAWDQTTKVLVIKSESQNRSNLSNVQIINLDFVSDVKLKKESVSPAPAQPASLNVQRLNNRAEEQIRQKRRLVDAAVSPEGQRLYAAIKKTIDEVAWRNDDILVMDKVLVTKPYTPDCVKPLNESVQEKKALDHVRKIVEKHVQDREGGKQRAGN
eukprot:TRINITY_DN32135_c0_g1_i1.p1 TRINITY_DN32135_c0_g1~~TRINITY_DN32135_c0_g1_i1.p1  ORF type:complete len:190 (-),score=48.43 TRINITY_DN32135_c0_g1_i1:2-571(-)